jgi:hypothetical protein
MDESISNPTEGAKAMSKPKVIRLAKGEEIIAVVPKSCHGPGWANQVVWVHVRTINGLLRTESIQPDERSPEMDTLFDLCEAACNVLLSAVPVKREKSNERI